MGFMLGTPFILIWDLIKIKPVKSKIIGASIPTLALVFIIVVGPMHILFAAASTWQTQTVLYRHGHLGFKTIECQMKNIGARGYVQREVEVMYLTSWFTITSDVPYGADKSAEWVWADEDINELGIK